MDMEKKSSRKLHNPKAHSPALYIPCWLAQVPNNLLSFAAKCLYGRLAQWSNDRGDVFRSYNQLAHEIGSTKRSINQYLRELRECGLIDTLHPQSGGLNHFVFFDHEWMYIPINEFLSYKPEQDPEQDSALPRAGFCSTPEQDSASINIKEIKEIKKDININAGARDEIEAEDICLDLNEPTVTKEKNITPNTYAEALYLVPSDTIDFLEEKKESDRTFDYFWAFYPVKKQKEFAKNVWWAQKCYLITEDILVKLHEQIKNDSQFLDGFAPNPAKYLTEQRWKDEVFKRPTKKSQSTTKSQPAMSFKQRDWRK